MRLRLRTLLSLQSALLVLLTVSLVSLLASGTIRQRFETYVTSQQQQEADDLANGIESHYSPESGGWNIDYVHGMGMYALKDGYILRLYDAEGACLWDAEDHDMALCHEVMDTISQRMREKRPELAGDFVTSRYELHHLETLVGALEISYYTPYYMDENDFQFVTALNHSLLGVGAVALLLAVGIGLLLAIRLTRPLSSAVEATRRIAAGDYAAPQIHSRTAELNTLQEAVGQLATSLQAQEGLRRQLTSDIAHELRTPVANIASCLEMMTEGVLEPTAERLQAMAQEIHRLSGLIADLERLESEEGTRLTLTLEPVALRALTEQTLQGFAIQLQEKGLSAQVFGEECELQADRARLQQVLVNLLSNAIKYTDEGGSIRITLQADTASVILRVADSGMGIPSEDLERVFERFYRTDKSRNRKTGGAGIGLTITRAIVQAHGGTIHCESQLGEGTCFTVTLPKGDQRR